MRFNAPCLSAANLCRRDDAAPPPLRAAETPRATGFHRDATIAAIYAAH